MEPLSVIVLLHCVLRGGCKEHFYWWWIRPALSASATSRGKVLGSQQFKFLLQLRCGCHRDFSLSNDRKLRLAVVISGRRRHSTTSFRSSVHLLSYRGGQQISSQREKFSTPNCKRLHIYNSFESNYFFRLSNM